jgi:O-antigen ligase
MDLSPSHWLQLNIAAALALASFVLIYLAPVRWLVPGLILILPFPLITSQYGSFNIYLIYLVAVLLLLRGHFRAVPYIGFVGVIWLAYGISLSQAPLLELRDHLFYLFFIGSNFLLFYIVYNYYRNASDARGFLYLFMVLNGAILLYSLVQMVVGLNPNSPLFGDQFGLRPPREDGRLTGPFVTVGLTAEYMVIAVFITGFTLLTAKPRPWVKAALILLMLGNFAAMIATANRGAVFTLLICGVLFLILFRRELGPRGIFISAIGIPFAFALAAAVVINYTDFDRLFERLEDTELAEGVPDTRVVVWPLTWELIQERPLVGYGPEWKLSERTFALPGVRDQYPMPHNLYLFVTVTIGSLGLAAYLLFWGRLSLQYYSASRCSHEDPVFDGLPRLALVLMFVFLIDQIKVEFLRTEAPEFQHVIFMLWGALAALTERKSA